MAVPMSTLVPLKKFAAKAFAIPSSLGCHQGDTAKCLYHRWKHQTCKDHGPPAPHHINFRAPSHCHQVSGFKEE
eukprot:Skav234051  [mRNA]  locus=scaffold619:61638:62080:- [translate_table: standard]